MTRQTLSVVEQIYSQVPLGASESFYRTAAGAELDLRAGLANERIEFQIKFSSATKIGKGFGRLAMTWPGTTSAPASPTTAKATARYIFYSAMRSIHLLYSLFYQ